VEVLTHQAHSGTIAPAVPAPPHAAERVPAAADPLAACTRALYRGRQGHLLLTGRKGVGKSTLVRELARRAAGGEVPILAGRQFFWIDAAQFGAEDSRAERPFRPEQGIEYARQAMSRLQQPFTREFEARFREISVELPWACRCLRG
jgi:hypothetical protein